MPIFRNNNHFVTWTGLPAIATMDSAWGAGNSNTPQDSKHLSYLYRFTFPFMPVARGVGGRQYPYTQK